MRGLRPLAWWAVFVLVLFAIHEHQEWIQRTRLGFSVSLEGQPLPFEVTATLDDRPISSGDRLSLGPHTFAIKHPKVELFSMDLFIWYGERNLGDITLKRAVGVLAVDAHPLVRLLTIRGPEFSLTLTNSAGLTSSVPTDVYAITAEYANWQERQEVAVYGRTTTSRSFAPRLGILRVESNRGETEFEVRSANDTVVKVGKAPTTIPDLPAGNYRVICQYHGNRRESSVLVGAGQTNLAQVDYVFGAAMIESQPSGARVATVDGRELGATPLLIPELQLGLRSFIVRIEGYLPAAVGLEISADQTNSFRTNLLNATFVSAMEQARQAMEATNFLVATEALVQALRQTPGDSAAEELLRKARLGGALQSAESKARLGDYRGALEQAQAALAISPDLEAAKQIVVVCQAKIQENEEKLEQQRAVAQRAQHPRQIFNQRMRMTRNSSLFEDKETKVKGTLADVEVGLVLALTNQAPAFKLLGVQHPDSQTFFLQALLPMKSAGWRRCDLVGGQTADGQVTIIFKVFEYAYVEQLSIRALVGDNDEKNMMPVHQSRLAENKRYLLARITEGVRMVQERIREAVHE